MHLGTSASDLPPDANLWVNVDDDDDNIDENDAEIVEKLVARRSDCRVKAQLSVTRSESAVTGVYGQY